MGTNSLVPSVCIDAVLEGRSLDDAISLVGQCGFSAFEFWSWWDKDLDELVAQRDKNELEVAACCTKVISLVDPSLREKYLEGLAESITAAETLECSTVISQVGNFVTGNSREEQRQSLIDGLLAAAPLVEAADISLVIEPLNEKVDYPGYFLVHSQEAFEIVEAVGSPNVKVLFDIYHQQVSEGDLIKNITDNIDKIGHFHAAGNPGRKELSGGEINYPEVFTAIESSGYSGFVGLEYFPKRDPAAGLFEVASLFE